MRVNVQWIKQHGFPVAQTSDREWQVSASSADPLVEIDVECTVSDIDREFDYVEVVVFNESGLASSVHRAIVPPMPTQTIRKFVTPLVIKPERSGRYIVSVFAGSEVRTPVDSTAERLLITIV